MTFRKGLFSIVIILFWFSLYAYVPQLTNYANELGASFKLIGLIAGAYGLTQTILRIPIGILSDKLMNRKIFIVLGTACTILSASIAYFIQNPYALLVTRLIAGIASATWVNFTILFLSYFDAYESPKSVGIATANSKIGQLLAMFIGGFIAVRYNIRNLFLLSTFIGVICFLLGLLIYEEKILNQKRCNDTYGIINIFKNKNTVIISILGLLVQLITYATNFGFTPIVASYLGADNFQLSILTTVFTLPQVIFSILSGTVITKKYGEKNTLMFGFILTTSICFITPFVQDLLTLYILQFISGIGNAITFTLLMSMVIEGVESNMMTTTMGFFQAVYGIGMIIGPIILGVIGDNFNLTTGFMVVGIIGLIPILLVNNIKYKKSSIKNF